MTELSYKELLSSLDEFAGTTLDDMPIMLMVGWLRALANILAFMVGLPEINQETTVEQLREYVLTALQRANELPTK